MNWSFEEVAMDVDFSEWTELEFLPGRDEFLALQKDGTFRHFSLDGASATQLGTFSLDTFDESDCGVISIAFDPDFESNKLMYVGRCVSQTHSGVFRYRFDSGSYEMIAKSEAEVIVLGAPQSLRPWHSVGSIGFFPDGSLWALFGEKTLPENGQDTSTALGAAVRVVPRRGQRESGYTIPDDAVDLGRRSAPEIHAYGLRSPWRGGTNARGDLWIGDVGGNKFEELNLVATPGDNFGWNLAEGPCEDQDCTGIVDPIAWYDRNGSHPYEIVDPDAIPTTNRVIWTGSANVPGAVDPYNGSLADKILFGDMCVGFMRMITLDEKRRVIADVHVAHVPYVSSVAQGPGGFMYLSTYGACATSPTIVPETSRLLRIRITE